MAKLKTGLSSYNVAIGKYQGLSPSFQKPQIGKVTGVVTTENTPTKELFEQAQGFAGIGVIFYQNYDIVKNIVEDVNTPATLAFPLFPQVQNIPLIGELVQIIEAPSPLTQVRTTAFQKYYITLNLWNNVQQNSSLVSDKTILGSTFVENPNIRHLVPFIGDYIIQSRQGSSLRFSTTTKQLNEVNEWSSVGNDIDPITILTNGLDFDPNKNYYVEQINKDKSSIYLTSTQKIPLQTDKNGNLNNLTNPLDISNYTNSQTILNADRITLNSKKDEVMIFAKTNVEINTKNIINLNADTRVHLNSNSILLGPYDPNHIPQPMLLGTETLKLFEYLYESLGKLAGYLSKTIGVPEGSPMIDLNNAGNELLNDLDKLYTLLEKIPSRRILIAPDDAIQTSPQPQALNQQNEATPIQASFVDEGPKVEEKPKTVPKFSPYLFGGIRGETDWAFIPTSHEDFDPEFEEYKNGNAWDVGVPIGTPVYSPIGGTVTRLTNNGAKVKVYYFPDGRVKARVYGSSITIANNTLILYYPQTDKDGNPVGTPTTNGTIYRGKQFGPKTEEMFFTHMYDLQVKLKDEVKVGQLLGYIMDFPDKDFDHLHIAVPYGDNIRRWIKNDKNSTLVRYKPNQIFYRGKIFTSEI